MSEAQWAAVDDYVTGLLVPADPALDAALAASAAAGLPPYQVSPAQGKLLMLLARLQGARSVLEVGTLGGYSTIWLARGVPEGGRVVTLEADPAYAAVARANVARAGLAGVVDVRVGDALDTLPVLAAERLAPRAGRARSTWCSSTPTRSTTRPTSAGRSASRDAAA
jgi:predicted O-methyltransferase YrrM